MMTINDLLGYIGDWCKTHHPSYNGRFILHKKITPTSLGSMKKLSMELWYVKTDKSKLLMCSIESMENYSEQTKNEVWEKVEKKFIPVIFDVVFKK